MPRAVAVMTLAGLVGCTSDPVDSETDDTDVARDVFDVDGLASGTVVWVPSSVGGDIGLATRIVWPMQRQRYPSGHPVVLEIVGGGGAGDLGIPGMPVGYDLPGVVHVTLVLPGGGRDPWISGGTFDQRGAASRKAVQDVLAFARGETRLSDGTALSDIVGTVDAATTVVLGNSHGGNLATAALSEAGQACGLVLWETPVADVFVTVDLGAVEGDPDKVVDGDADGIPWDDGRHPTYVPGSCTIEGCGLTYGPLVHDREGWFRDGNADGVRGNPLDANGDGVLGPDEDFAYGTYLAEDGRNAASVAFTTALTEATATFPSDLLGREEAVEYWAMRTALPRFPALSARLPDLRAIYVATTPDHVQATPDHAHVRLGYEGLRNAGIWTRLNPDEAYVRGLIGGSAPLPETVANATLDDAGYEAAFVTDKARAAAEALRKAAVLEVADRCHEQESADNLGRMLFPAPEARKPE